MAKVNYEFQLEGLKDVVKTMLSAGINFEAKHWLAKDIESAKKVRKTFTKIATSPLYVKQSRHLEQKPCCNNPLCCDPEHFTVIFKKTYESLGMSKEDFEELLEELDFEEIKRVGEMAYIEKFNSGLPDNLKISLTILKTAINIHKNK